MNPDPTSLDQLHDIVPPPPIPWWPPAPGWLWLLGALAFFGVIGAAWLFARWQRNRYRREALAEWRRLQPQCVDATQQAQALPELAGLLKRTALSACPRTEVARLTGDAWYAFLDRTGATTGFSGGAGPLLESSAYDSRRIEALRKTDIQNAVDLVRHWIVNHRVIQKGDQPC